MPKIEMVVHCENPEYRWWAFWRPRRVWQKAEIEMSAERLAEIGNRCRALSEGMRAHQISVKDLFPNSAS
jgi:hypothetical protein